MDGAPMTAAALAAALDARADPERAAAQQRYFKTGPGEYGEGDVFAGVTVPAVRATVAAFAALPLAEAESLLGSPVHEHRLAALLVLVARFDQASRARSRDDALRGRLHDAYLASVRRGEVDNWDLVDSSAEVLVGRWLRDQPDTIARARLDALAASALLWERRVAMIATFAWTKAGDPGPTFRIATALLDDPAPLIHKATGWMLREVGTRVGREELVAFLEERAGRMPRTTLSAATERVDPSERARLRAIPRR